MRTVGKNHLWLNAVLFVVMLVQLSASNARAQDATTDDVWQGMLDGGLITQAQFDYAIEHGQLPGTQPVATPAKTDDAQTNVKKPAVNTLTYEARNKKRQAKLAALAKRLREKYRIKREEAVSKAKLLGWPIREELPDGGSAELQMLEHGMPIYHITENATAADTISTDEVWPTGTNGFSLTGSPITLGMWDIGGVRVTHQELTGRVTQVDGPVDVTNHPTTVAGTMIATGLYGLAKGMAFQSQLDAYDWNTNLVELAEAVSNDMRISNHSYGFSSGWKEKSAGWYWYGNTNLSQTESHYFGRYNSSAKDADVIVYDAVYHLPVWSAGNERNDVPPTQPTNHFAWNGFDWQVSSTVRPVDGGADGFDSLSFYKVAKNVLVVGAVNDITNGYTEPGDVVMTDFSSFGPTDDGRIKPDIVANGTLVRTLHAGSDASYTDASGTSWAAPSVAGSLGLLQQLHESLYGTNQPLLASTYKALVIHTADEAGDHDGPDYRFGWGLMNTLSAAYVVTNTTDYNSKPHIKEAVLPDNDYIEFEVQADTNEPLRVTICWTDPPGAEHPYALDPTNLVLVNDLDLRVISPDGSTTNEPWILDPTSPTNAATTGDNFRDNVEQVHIDSPSNGLYTVKVTHKGTLTNEMQDVSIIVTGNIASNVTVQIADIERDSGGDRTVTWNSVVGSLYIVNASTNLVGTNIWAQDSFDLPATKQSMSWVDGGSTNGLGILRFYRIKGIE